MRHPVKNRQHPKADSLYNSDKVGKFINYIMLDGKKEAARKIVYGAFEQIKEKTKNPNPLEIFELALKNTGPTMEVRSRRIGGANYQVPREVRPERRLALSMRWIIQSARKSKGTDMTTVIANELMSAADGEGAAVKKKEDTHKMAESNKAFAHFSW